MQWKVVQKATTGQRQRISVSGVLGHKGSIVFILLRQGSGTVLKTVRRTGVDQTGGCTRGLRAPVAASARSSQPTA